MQTKCVRPVSWVVMGVSGCGKSAVGRLLADQLGAEFVEGDAFHSAANVATMAAGVPLTDFDRAGWLALLAERLAVARQKGHRLVLACSALKRPYRDQLRSGDPDLCFAHLSGSCAVLAQRLQGRSGHFMPASLLDSQLRDLEPLESGECGLQLDIAMTPAALVETIPTFDGPASSDSPSSAAFF